MPKKREDYHNVNAQIPNVAWRAIVAEADQSEQSVSQLLTTILFQRYRIPAKKIPKSKRTGRRPKKDS